MGSRRESGNGVTFVLAVKASQLVYGHGSGAKLGSSGGQSSFLDGELDEWRFWHGERTRQELLRLKDKPLTPSLTTAYGDPEAQLLPSRIMANFNFDQSPPLAQSDSCTNSGTIPCPLLSLMPIFPLDEDPRMKQLSSAGQPIYQANGNQLRSSPAGIFYVQGAASITDGFLKINAPAPGFYQVRLTAPRFPVSLVDVYLSRCLSRPYASVQVLLVSRRLPHQGIPCSSCLLPALATRILQGQPPICHVEGGLQWEDSFLSLLAAPGTCSYLPPTRLIAGGASSNLTPAPVFT